MLQNWNDLQFFLAVYEAGSLTAAAKRLKVDETTVGRRLSALETELGTRLLHRKRGGYSLTPSGEKVRDEALPIRSKLTRLSTLIEGADLSLQGIVKVTLPESVAVHCVIPQLPDFFYQHPKLRLELLTSAQTIKISQREADIAVRMFKPKTGTLYARRLGKIKFQWYVSRNYLKLHPLPSAQNLSQCIFLDYPSQDATDAEHLQLSRLRKIAQSRIQVGSRFSVLASIRAGLGMGLLPSYLANSETDLIEVHPFVSSLALETWMVVHADLKKNARIRATADFLEQVLKSQLDP